MRIQVIGAGSWGLALARRLALNGHAVSLWCREEDEPDTLAATRRSPFYLPGVTLPDSVDVSRKLAAEFGIAILAAPSHAMRAVLTQVKLPPGCIAVSVAKGIENDSLLRMSQVIEAVCPHVIPAVLSGPSHAEEVARDLPASLVAAAGEGSAAERVQSVFFAKTFRVYTSADLVGVELGGALKNVAAIAAGVCDGMGLGDNAKAALITRSLAEMSRLGVACGADPLTFAGLSGMGDLIVTCASKHSRNRAVGEALAAGKTLEAFERETHMVAEGVRTARSSVALARRQGIEMPIAEAVHAVLFEGVPPLEAVSRLLERDAKPESV